mgnify:CR=1 FL=1
MLIVLQTFITRSKETRIYRLWLGLVKTMSKGSFQRVKHYPKLFVVLDGVDRCWTVLDARVFKSIQQPSNRLQSSGVMLIASCKEIILVAQAKMLDVNGWQVWTGLSWLHPTSLIVVFKHITHVISNNVGCLTNMLDLFKRALRIKLLLLTAKVQVVSRVSVPAVLFLANIDCNGKLGLNELFCFLPAFCVRSLIDYPFLFITVNLVLRIIWYASAIMVTF